MSEISSAISGAISTVENVGKAAGDAVQGNFSGAVGDLGKALPGALNAAVGGFLAMNPELGMLGDLGGALGGMLGQAGGFNPGQAGGNPSPFGIGNLLPGITQNPLGSLFGGGGSTGSSSPFGGLSGLLGGGGTNAGGGATGTGATNSGGSTTASGTPDVNSYINNMQSSLQQNLNFQNQMNQIQQAFGQASAILQMENDLIKQMTRAING
jgi:hypothetical protein